MSVGAVAIPLVTDAPMLPPTSAIPNLNEPATVPAAFRARQPQKLVRNAKSRHDPQVTDRRSSLRRVKSANFPRDKWLGDFDYEANPNINQATINTLSTGDWIRKGQPLCLIGDSGTGKSHLLIGL